MPHIGIPELILILVIVLVIFGAGKLPQVVGSLGKGIHEFRKAQRDDLDEDGKSEAGKIAGVAAEQAKK